LFCFVLFYFALGEVVGVLLGSTGNGSLVGILGLADASILGLNDLEVGSAARTGSPSADGLLAPIV